MAALFPRVHTGHQSQCPPTDGWIQKQGYKDTVEYSPQPGTRTGKAIYSPGDGTRNTRGKGRMFEREQPMAQATPSLWSLTWGTWEPFDGKETQGVEHRLGVARVEGEHTGRRGTGWVRGARPGPVGGGGAAKP